MITYKKRCERSHRFAFYFTLLDLACGKLLKISIDKSVDITVHYRVNISVLVSRTCILGKSVGHKYVGSDLATPLDIRLVTLDIFNTVKLFAELDLHQLCLQHLNIGLLVLKLASLCLTANYDTRRLMHDTDSRVGLVDVLTACA